MTLRARGLVAALACAALPAQAYVSGAGHLYEATCNASGIVLRSTYPVGRFFGQGAGTTISDTRETIYLGAHCDAARDGFGAGTWGWANGGFRVTFPEIEIGFPRQEIHCDDAAMIDIDPCRF